MFFFLHFSIFSPRHFGTQKHGKKIALTFDCLPFYYVLLLCYCNLLPWQLSNVQMCPKGSPKVPIDVAVTTNCFSYRKQKKTFFIKLTKKRVSFSFPKENFLLLVFYAGISSSCCKKEQSERKKNVVAREKVDETWRIDQNKNKYLFLGEKLKVFRE